MFKYQEMGQTPEQFRENIESLAEAGFNPPPEEEWPPLYEDLPYEAQEALRMFYILPSKIDGMAGYTGKELSCLETFYNIYEVPRASRKTITDILMHVINESIKTSAEKMKKSVEGKKNG